MVMPKAFPHSDLPMVSLQMVNPMGMLMVKLMVCLRLEMLKVYPLTVIRSENRMDSQKGYLPMEMRMEYLRMAILMANLTEMHSEFPLKAMRLGFLLTGCQMETHLETPKAIPKDFQMVMKHFP